MNFRNETLTRRRMIGLFGGLGAAVASGGFLAGNQAAAAGGPLEATIDVYAFTEPYNGSEVVREILAGEVVENLDPLNPEVVNGYRHLRLSDGLAGWALDYAFEPVGGSPEDPVFNIIRFLTREDAIFADPYGDVIADLVFGTQVEASTIRDGEFVLGRVWLEGGPVEGWVRNWLLTPDTAVVRTVVLPDLTGSAPMLAEPNADAEVIAEIPHDSKVIDYDGEIVNDYRGVESAYGPGWISQEYLGVG